jgi:hypothetical protein
MNDHRCMRDIDPSYVVDVAHRLLVAAGGSSAP